MCNYVTEFLLQSPGGNGGEGFALSSDSLLSSFPVDFAGEDDDNRGSGR
ncbi:MAG: hypothetical protein LDL41_13820 [Coleofasciculus sp. S288]|mgnify:CR=1 FL=1|nr:hypothetical protein [Coleofasciculus sp. S288]